MPVNLQYLCKYVVRNWFRQWKVQVGLKWMIDIIKLYCVGSFEYRYQARETFRAKRDVKFVVPTYEDLFLYDGSESEPFVDSDSEFEQ